MELESDGMNLVMRSAGVRRPEGCLSEDGERQLPPASRDAHFADNQVPNDKAYWHQHGNLDVLAWSSLLGDRREYSFLDALVVESLRGPGRRISILPKQAADSSAARAVPRVPTSND